MKRFARIILITFISVIVLNCGTNQKPSSANAKSKNKPTKTTSISNVKIPPSPIGYKIIEDFSMSRGDFGIKIKVEKNLTKAEVIKLAKYFQNYGIRGSDRKMHKLTLDGGLRMIQIYVPYPKNSKPNYQDVYVLKNDIRDLWF